jgi:hypothetical protein
MLFSVEEGLDLMDEQQVDQIIEELLEFADDWKLIIFDTQADHMPNGDEDKAKDFTVIKKRCSGSPMQPAQQSVSYTTPAGTTQGSATAAGSGCGEADQRPAHHQHQAEVRAKVPADHVRRRAEPRQGRSTCGYQLRLSS